MLKKLLLFLVVVLLAPLGLLYAAVEILDDGISYSLRGTSIWESSFDLSLSDVLLYGALALYVLWILICIVFLIRRKRRHKRGLPSTAPGVSPP